MEEYIRCDIGVDRDRPQVDTAQWILQNTLQYYTFAFTMWLFFKFQWNVTWNAPAAPPGIRSDISEREMFWSEMCL